MALFRGNEIRGGQIKDHSVSGDQIILNTLSNDHIASDASISETKLNIDWHAHKEILKDRKVVDFVQANGIKVSGTEVADLETQIPAIVGVPHAGASDNVEGIIVEKEKNIVTFRDAVTGDPIIAEIGGVDYEVIARMEYDTANSKYVIRFYTASGAAGAEVAYDLGTTQINVDLQYAQRFNLASVSEMFAANEKFVHGAADVTAHLNLEQLAKDIYGNTWALDRDGNANLASSIADQLAAEVSRAQLAETALTTSISQEATNRTNADLNLQGAINIINGDATTVGSVDNKIKLQVTDILTSGDVGKGASTVAISPIAGLSATNVQAALAELKVGAGDALVTYKADVASTEDAKGANLVGVEAAFGFNGATVEAVLEDHETRLDVLEGNATVAGSVDNKIKLQVIDELAATTAGKGAALVAVDATSGLNAANVQGVLVDHETRLDTAEASLAGALDRSLSANGYFVAKADFATIDARFEDDEKIVDANLKRVDDRDAADRVRAASANAFFAAETKATLKDRFADIETVVDAKAQEITTARGTKTDLAGRLSVSMRADGFLVEDHKLHIHKKYTYTVASNTKVVNLPAGEMFNINNPTGNGVVLLDCVNVYVNGILQSNGINFTEIADSVQTTKGIGIDFGTEELPAGDTVVIEWIVNNAN